MVSSPNKVVRSPHYRWLALLLAGFCLTVQALPELPKLIKPSQFEGLQVLRVFFETPDQLARIATFARPLLVDRRAGFVLLLAGPSERSRLVEMGLKAAIDQAATELYRAPPTFDQLKSIPGYGCYRTVEETRQTARALVQERPDLARLVDIGDSWVKQTGTGRGYDLQVLIITNRQLTEYKPPLFVNSAIHAREYATAEFTTRFAEFLVSEYDADPQVNWLLDHREIHLLLVANPDGRKHAEQGTLWRKNANTAYCANDPLFAGADLNRNFSFEWGGWDGSSSDQCSEVFRGPAPASEPESQALMDYWRTLFGDHRDNDLVSLAAADTPGLFIDVHSFGRLVLWPWGFPGQPVPNGQQLRTLSRKMTFFNHYRPMQGVFLYPTDGTTTQFTYGDLGIASMTFELGDQFFERCNNYDAIVAANQPALLYALAVADAPYQAPGGPEMTELLLLPNSAAPGEQVTIRLAAADDRFGTLGGFEPDQGVERFELRIGLPGTTDQAGEADLSSSAEQGMATLELDTGSMTMGRYRITARARDTVGNPGPWQSAWLDIVDPEKTTVISGYVRNRDDNSPLSATVRMGDTATLTDPESGHYQLRLLPGEYPLSASRDNFRPEDGALIELRLGQQVENNLSLQPFCVIYSEDAENGLPGWIAEDTWGTTTETANSGQFSITDSPNSNYANQAFSTLTSPVLDFTGYDNIRLEFSYRCNTERDFDTGRFIVRRGSGLFNQVFSCTGDSADWQRTSVDLDVFSGFNNITLQLRLDSDQQITDDGWYIDDIMITGEADQCPGPPADQYALFGNLSGTWFDPDRAGEGFVLEVGLNDKQPVLILTWYTYEDGQPLWLIGSLPIHFNQSSARIRMLRSSGTGFGDAFDPSQVILTEWGELELIIRNPGEARISYRRADGQTGDFTLRRLTSGLLDESHQISVDEGRAVAGNLSGAWFDPAQPGHGLTVEIGSNTAGPVAIVTWYTYLQGRPVWLLGSAPVDPGSSIINIEMASFSGTGFGPAFDPEQISSTPWGPLRLDFSDCRKVQLSFEFEQGSGTQQLARVSGGLLGLGCYDPK